MLPSDQSRTIEQAKFTYSSLVKAKKKTRTVEDQGRKQVESLKTLKPVEQKQNQNELKTFIRKSNKIMKLKIIKLNN